ncbi:MAG: hypothetical protein ACTS40_01560 [Candidatus Hodgkinia cicadicola]
MKDSHSAGFCVPLNTFPRFVKLIRSTFATQNTFPPAEMALSLAPIKNRGSLRMRKQTLHPAGKFTSEAMMQVLTKSPPHHAEEVSESPSPPPGLRAKTPSAGKVAPRRVITLTLPPLKQPPHR